MLELSLYFLAGYGFGRLWHDVTVKKLKLNGKQVIRGFHFHHSLFGILALFLGVYILAAGDIESSIRLLSFGGGLLAEYYLEYGCIKIIDRKK